MTRDEQKIVALLGSLHDLSPEPETSGGSLQRRNEVPRALAPVVKVLCPTCGENDYPGRMKNLRPCRDCGGKPETDEPGRGWKWIDPYDELAREIGGEGGASAPGTVLVRCDYCEGKRPHPKSHKHICREGMRRRFPHTVDLASGEPVPIEDVVSRPADAEEVILSGILSRDRYSYPHVDHALSQLFDEHVHWARLVVRVHVEREIDAERLVGRRRLELTVSLAWIEHRVPKPIMVPPWLERGARFRNCKTYMHRARTETAGELCRERDRMIHELRQEHPVEDIARMIGLRKSAVYESLSREDARRAGVAA